MNVTLVRDEQSLEPYCTFGKLMVGGDVFETIELPWYPAPGGEPCGVKEHSCIGKGTYQLTHRFTEARGEHLLVTNDELGVYRAPADIPPGVYGRSLVLIHAANWAHELLGCIAPGAARSFASGEVCVTSSRASLKRLLELVAGAAELQLEIK